MADGLGKVGGSTLEYAEKFRMQLCKRMPTCLRLWIAAITAAAGFVALSVTSYADTPAVTDFGMQSSSLQYVWQQDEAPSGYAMFLTLYHDGRRQVEVRPIGNDAVVSFKTDHAAWELSPELMWFVNMPVYIREVPEANDARAL
ncbi:hypothetical protein [Alicyclobacillus sp. SO9]|uniref:hypothetical protein n=1 Tax=Alicyclobacillus sp. SO9 TaxID=2665646 RepID=UPI0018E86FF0|nr:hypothetical protein [Alicyclobacillus sp. SO9]QQE77465.1 hypothetical protein GI364_16130 [Alicyclobacillus sp. SO9]